MTTIESFDRVRRLKSGESFAKVKENPYDLGRKRNYEQIFGRSWLVAFLPIPTQLGDGYVFPTSDKVKARLQNTRY